MSTTSLATEGWWAFLVRCVLSGLPATLLLLSLPVFAKPYWTKPDNHLAFRVSGGYSKYQSTGDYSNRFWSTTLDAKYSIYGYDGHSFAIGVKGAYAARTQLTPDYAPEGDRNFQLFGVYMEYGGRLFLAGVGLYVAGLETIDNGSGRPGEAETPDSMPIFGGRFRFGLEDKFWADARSFHGPIITNAYSKGSLGVGAGLGPWGSLRAGISYAGPFLEPTLSVPMGWGRLIVAGHVASGGEDGWDVGVGLGCKVDHE
jgi:hypothetical protein